MLHSITRSTNVQNFCELLLFKLAENIQKLVVKSKKDIQKLVVNIQKLVIDFFQFPDSPILARVNRDLKKFSYVTISFVLINTTRKFKKSKKF